MWIIDCNRIANSLGMIKVKVGFDTNNRVTLCFEILLYAVDAIVMFAWKHGMTQVIILANVTFSFFNDFL